MKIKIKKFKKVKSTNDIAIKLVKSGVKKGIIISEQQTKGRGQRGNKWISNRGNLFLTVFFKISKKISIKKITRINIMIIQNTIRQASQILRNYNIISHELDAEIILADIMKVKREHFIINNNINISEKIIKKYYLAIKIRINKEPVAYITG